MSSKVTAAKRQPVTMRSTKRTGSRNKASRSLRASSSAPDCHHGSLCDQVDLRDILPLPPIPPSPSPERKNVTARKAQAARK